MQLFGLASQNLRVARFRTTIRALLHTILLSSTLVPPLRARATTMGDHCQVSGNGWTLGKDRG